MSTVKYMVFKKVNETRTHVSYFTPRGHETFLKKHVLREFNDKKSGKKFIIVTKWMLKKLRDEEGEEECPW